MRKSLYISDYLTFSNIYYYRKQPQGITLGLFPIKKAA